MGKAVAALQCCSVAVEIVVTTYKSVKEFNYIYKYIYLYI